MRKMYLRVSTTRTIGAETRSWQLGEEIEVTSTSEIRAKYNAMHNFIAEIADEWSGASPGGGFNAEHAGMTGAAPLAGPHEIQRIIISYHGGKKLVRLAGGRYSKWGVPFYPELWGFVEPDIDQMTDGEYPARGTMEVEIEDGKAKRVSRVIGLSLL